MAPTSHITPSHARQTEGNIFPEQHNIGWQSLWSAGAKSLRTLQRRSFQRQTRVETPLAVLFSFTGGNIPAHLLQSNSSFTWSMSVMQIVHQPVDSFAVARKPSLCGRFLQRRILERWSNRWSPSSVLSKQHYITINCRHGKWSCGTNQRKPMGWVAARTWTFWGKTVFTTTRQEVL